MEVVIDRGDDDVLTLEGVKVKTYNGQQQSLTNL